MFDRNNPAHLQALKDEVNNDPLTLGYASALAVNDAALLDLLNAENPAFTVSKPKISSALVRSAVTYNAYNNLAIDEQEWLRWITGSNGFHDENLVVTADLRDQLTTSASFWAAGDRTEMQAAMLALIDIPGSRAEVLFGINTNLSQQDWFAARDS